MLSIKCLEDAERGYIALTIRPKGRLPRLSDDQNPSGCPRLGLSDPFRSDVGQAGDAPQAQLLPEELSAEVVMVMRPTTPMRSEPSSLQRALKAPRRTVSRAQSASVQHTALCPALSGRMLLLKLKWFRRVATRYERTARNYFAVVAVAATRHLWR